jgi:hypothetical protein
VRDLTDPYLLPQAIFDCAENLEEYERFLDLFKKDLIVVARMVGRRKMHQMEVSPYAGALLKRGLMKGEPRENISPKVEEGMMFTSVVGVELTVGLVDLGKVVDGFY